MARESVSKTFVVAIVLAAICSLLVAGAAIGLRSRQEANKVRDRKKNILIVAGLYDAKAPVEKSFEQIEPRIVDLATGASRVGVIGTVGTIASGAYQETIHAIGGDRVAHAYLFCGPRGTGVRGILLLPEKLEVSMSFPKQEGALRAAVLTLVALLSFGGADALSAKKKKGKAADVD